MRKRTDLAFEALIEETRSNPHFERGKINQALKAIRIASFHEGIPEEELAVEIRLRADIYRRRWPEVELTAPALAKHWYRMATPVQPRSAAQQALDELRRRE